MESGCSWRWRGGSRRALWAQDGHNRRVEVSCAQHKMRGRPMLAALHTSLFMSRTAVLLVLAALAVGCGGTRAGDGPTTPVQVVPAGPRLAYVFQSQLHV